MTLKLLSYNIRYGGVGREKLLADVIRESAPDIVVFQEATRPQVVERLATETGMGTWAARAGYSLGFMSRLEIAHHEWHRPAGVRHPFLEIVPAGADLRVFGVHLSAVHSSWTERRRVGELRGVLGGIKPHRESFHVLAGDFNTLAPGEILDVRKLPPRLRPFVWLSGGRIQWETIRVMLDSGYLDGYRILHPQDKGFTFPTWDPHLRLDYVFLPVLFAGRLTACQVIQESPQVTQASDHLPLLARLGIEDGQGVSNGN
ncbi:MAG TPA: endonuclease/exonuclease/phosphatase family protein [Blastocatellia bacterium]|nr:endonuclease/exonuclease/phosphatase family protein [Blastocatellia bacterium]